MKYNRVKVPLVSPSAVNEQLYLGSPDAGYNAASDFVGFGVVPYLVTWGAGKYEIGIGSVLAGGVFSRRLTAYENDLGTTASQAISLPATFTIIPTMQLAVASSCQTGTPPRATGANSLAVGGAAVASQSATSFGSSAVASGDTSTAIGFGSAASAPGSVAINTNGLIAGSSGETRIGRYARRDFIARTTDATPTTATDIRWSASGVTTIPVGELWRIKACVVGAEFDQNAEYPLSGNARTFSCLASAAGAVTSVQSVTTETFGGFTGTSAMTVTSSGDITFTLTGVAGKQIDWAISFEFQALVPY